MRALVNALIIHLTLNLLVFLKGWHAFEGKKRARLILVVVFATEFLIYLSGFLFYRALPEMVVQQIRVMGTSWMLFLLYSGGLWLLIDLIALTVLHQWRTPIHSLKEAPRKRRILLFILPVILVVGIMVQGRHRFMHPVVQPVHVTLYKQAGNYDSLRIVVAGDMHLGWMINRNHTRRFVDLIMAQQADLILFVGDIFDAQIEPVLQQGMDQELRRLSAPLGVYTCTGNHEYRHDSEAKIALLNNAGITVLRDTAVLIDSAFYVVGREDRVITDRKSTVEILHDAQVDHTMPVMLLNHTPDNLREEADAGIDIALFGHTHHGQAFPGNLITEWIFEVTHGYKKKGDTHCYVTSGLGLVGPQYRIGTQSEIALLTVVFE